MSLYLVRLFTKDATESFHKIGITAHDATSRLSFGTTKVMDAKIPLTEKFERVVVHRQNYVPDNPYEHEVLHSVRYKLGGDARLAEREVLKQVSSFRYQPRMNFSGYSECFRNEDIIESIVQFMNADSDQRNAEAPNDLLYELMSTKARASDPIEKHLQILEMCGGERRQR